LFCRNAGLSPDLLSRHSFFPASQKGRQSPADYLAYFINQKPAEVLLFLPLFLTTCKKEVQDFNSEIFLFKSLSLIFKPGLFQQRFRRQLGGRSRLAKCKNLAH